MVADLLTALQHETGDARLGATRRRLRRPAHIERPFMEEFAADVSSRTPAERGRFNFTVENATTRRIEDPRWERIRRTLTISCSYHVAMTSLLHEVPVVYLYGTDYYRQKAMSLQAGFGLSPELTIDIADPGSDAAGRRCRQWSVSNRATSCADGQPTAPRPCPRGTSRAPSSSRLIELVSTHMASAHEEDSAEDRRYARRRRWNLRARSPRSAMVRGQAVLGRPRHPNETVRSDDDRREVSQTPTIRR